MAMVERTLEPAQLHEIEVHIDQCRQCRRVVAAAALAAGSQRTLAAGSIARDDTDGP
jgi:hypothetical protein